MAETKERPADTSSAVVQDRVLDELKAHIRRDCATDLLFEITNADWWYSVPLVARTAIVRLIKAQMETASH